MVSQFIIQISNTKFMWADFLPESVPPSLLDTRRAAEQNGNMTLNLVVGHSLHHYQILNQISIVKYNHSASQ